MSEAEKVIYKGIKTEMNALVLSFGPDDDYKRGFNEAMKKSLEIISVYQEGKGVFQIADKN